MQMKFTNLLLPLVLGAALTACTFDTPSPTAKPGAQTAKKLTGHKGERQELLFRVAPKKAACQGIVGGQRQCLVINGQLFYETINGYTHQPGTGRLLAVERLQVCDPAIINDCPQDASIFRYRLLKVVE